MAVARETLSPLFKNSQTRRLSLELCQKLGFGSIFNSSTSPAKSLGENLHINKNELLKTPSPNKSLSYWPQNSNGTSPNFRSSSGPKTPSNNCRRGSDSFRWNCSPVLNLQNDSAPRPIRRGSLTLTQLKDTHKPQQNDAYSHTNQYPWGPRRNSASVLLQIDHLDNILSDKENGNYKIEKYKQEAFSPNTPTEEVDGGVKGQKEDWCLPERENFVKKKRKSPNEKTLSKESLITCNIIPPSPKSSLNAELRDENDNIYPDYSIDIFSAVPHQVLQPFNTISQSEYQSPFKWQDEKRRKSSSSRYDFDDDFMNFVATNCNLELDPNDILGRGSFGTVITAHYHGKSVAVKLINTKSAKHSESMKSEENAIGLPSHPNVAKVIDIFQLGPDKALVVMERLRKGNLLTILNDPRISIQMPLKIKLCTEIGSALVFCHVHGILHLDVKPQNVLIDFHDRCKLSDFGNSRRVSDLPFLSDFNKLDGTVPYKAPELFRGVCPSEKCDVYSFGIFMWQILARETPYKAEADHSIIYKVVSQGLRPRSKSSLVSPQLQAYIQIYEECWCQEPHCRPNMKVVLQKLHQLKA